MRTWFITGTSSGFGRHLTELLLARGDRVAATLRSPDRLAGLAAAYPDTLWIRDLDVTDTDRLRAVVAEAFGDVGRIDVIVSNAGYGLFGAAEELSDEQIRSQVDTNLLAPVQLARAVVPHLRRQGGGTIVQLSSLGGQTAFPGMSLYHATKWGVEGFFEALGSEVAPFGIRTVLVEPGMSRTSFAGPSAASGGAGAGYEDVVLRAGSIPLEAMPGDPRKVAEAIAEVASRPDPPRRVALGSDAFAMIGDALRDRLAALADQRELAFSTDADDFTGVRAAAGD